MKLIQFNWEILGIAALAIAGWSLTATSTYGAAIQIDFADSYGTEAGWNLVLGFRDADNPIYPINLLNENGVASGISIVDANVSGSSVAGSATFAKNNGEPGNGVLPESIGDDGIWIRNDTGDPAPQGSFLLSFEGLDPVLSYTVEIYTWNERSSSSRTADLDILLDNGDVPLFGTGEYDVGAPTVFNDVVFAGGFMDLFFSVSNSVQQNANFVTAIRIVPIPEPASALLLMAGGGAMLLRRRSSFKH